MVISARSRLLPMLAIAMKAGQLESAISLLARIHDNPHLRFRLHGIEEGIANGDDTLQAMSKHGILSRKEARMISMAKSRAAQAWLLRWAANCRQWRRLFWYAAIQRLFASTSLLVLAVVIALTSIGLFMPLISIIQALS